MITFLSDAIYTSCDKGSALFWLQSYSDRPLSRECCRLYINSGLKFDADLPKIEDPLADCFTASLTHHWLLPLAYLLTLNHRDARKPLLPIVGHLHKETDR